MKAESVAVYTHRDPTKLVASWAGKRIHRGEDIPVVSFDRGFLESAASGIERRTALTVSVTEKHLYLELNGQTFSSDIHSVFASRRRRIGAMSAGLGHDDELCRRHRLGERTR